MKLLGRTLIYYIVFSMVIFSLGGLAFYKFVQHAIVNQIDAGMITEKEIIEDQLLTFDSVPDFTSVFGHEIEVNIFGRPVVAEVKIKDTLIMKSGENNYSGYRYLVARGNMPDNRGYQISLFKSLGETRSLLTDLFVMICLVFSVLSILLVFVNYQISRKIWTSFRNTILKIRTFDIHENKELNLTPSNIWEFDQLNTVLNAMSKKLCADFINLKEFTEDAAHEIQTPLSIINSKLELLSQSENLTLEQSQNLQSIFAASKRLSKLNHSLLLISKIQNQQFTASSKVNFSGILDRFLEEYADILQQKHILVTRNYEGSMELEMNSDLADILISNLLGNAIKHNLSGGSIFLSLTSRELIITNTGHPYKRRSDELFIRFKKGNQVSDPTGLGLSIVKKITSLYHMNIEYSIQENIHTIRLSFFNVT